MNAPLRFSPRTWRSVGLLYAVAAASWVWTICGRLWPAATVEGRVYVAAFSATLTAAMAVALVAAVALVVADVLRHRAQSTDQEPLRESAAWR